MRITRLEIRNFRSIKDLAVDLGETTVFVGPNNAGKTAILDALRMVLTRRWGQRGTGFTEYDVHVNSDADDPRKSPGVSVEITAEESKAGRWPTAVAEDLAEIVRLNLDTGLRSIALRTRWAWDEESGSFESAWQFLDAKREPLVGRSARRLNLERFWRYLPVFYLNALRDSRDEFSSRSQFWRRLLKSLEIPAQLESRAFQVLDRLNNRLLRADPRLREIAATLSGTTRIAARNRDGGLDLRMVPLKMWDLISRAEIILRNDPDSPWLPLPRQGQGIQSLSVIFLFQAFVEHLLRELYEEDSVPVLALEEPETHLHPQAARTLWAHVSNLPGQKILTTHSPYFVQHVPFRDLRIVRLTDSGTKVAWLPDSFSAIIPQVPGLEDVVESSEALQYAKASGKLTVHGALDDATYRRLLRCCATHEHRHDIERTLRDLRCRAALHVTGSELESLETWARRMRGEVLFADRWLIVEGQADYVIVHALAQAMNYDLDQHGVSVIDAQNNGSPVAFAVLARALGIPWLAVFDGDAAGMKYVRRIRDRGFADKEVEERCRRHDASDLEAQLVADGLAPELREILSDLGVANAASLTTDQLVQSLGKRKRKMGYAPALALRLRNDPDLAPRAPKAFREAIELLRKGDV